MEVLSGGGGAFLVLPVVRTSAVAPVLCAHWLCAGARSAGVAVLPNAGDKSAGSAGVCMLLCTGDEIASLVEL